MSKQQREWLRAALGAVLVPELERRGFERVLLAPDEAGGEIRRSFPFGRLRRPGIRGAELVEIQLDNYEIPAFRLNIGVVPPGGFEHEVTGWVSEEDARVHYLPVFFEMYEVAWRKKWFSVGHPPWTGSRASEADLRALVSRAVPLLDEIEACLAEGKVGKHLRKTR